MKKMIIGMLLTGVLLSAKDIKNHKTYRNKITGNRTIKTKKIMKNEDKNMENVKSGDAELIEGLSTEVRPQDDFYKYVNKKWLEKTKIPGTKSSWSNFVVLSEQNQEFLKNLIKELKNKEDISEDSDEAKILTIYEMYNNVEKRNKEGIEPIKSVYNDIDNLKNIDDLQKYIIKVGKEGIGLFYDWGVSGDLNDSVNNAVYLGSANLGLSKDYYQKDTPENREIIKEYKKYIARMLTYLNEKDVKNKAEKIFEFEKMIAQNLLTNEEEYDVEKYNNVRTLEELKSIVKNIDISKYLNELGVKTDKVIITEIKYYENLDKILNDKNIDVIKDYLKFHLINGTSNVLSEDLGQKSFDFYEKYLEGTKKRENLEKRTLAFVDGVFGDMIGKVYVEKYFSEQSKQNAIEMVDYIKKAFKNRIENLDWMSQETKNKALEKLSKFTVKIGYPDKWEDYSKIKLNKNLSLYENLRIIGKVNYEKELKKVGKPVDKKEWFMTAHEINAYYSPNQNEIVFPAGILQYPFYNYEKLGVGANFGGIGAIIGHEMTHGFDVSGSNYDGDGNINDWWTKEDKMDFEKATKGLEDEFSTYSVAKGINVNGKFTSTENTADLGGVNISYDALEMYLKDHPEKNVKEGEFTQNQLFFLNYARIWREKATQESLINQVKTDPHSPSIFRVNGILKNVDAFHKVFNTKAGDRLYKKEKNRIRIW